METFHTAFFGRRGLKMKHISLAFEFFFFHSRIVLMRMLAYRLDFILGILVSFLFSALAPLFQFLLYTNSSGYPGWSWDEILVFQGILILTGGLCETAFGSLRSNITALLERGEFDRLLLKPLPPLFIIMTSGFNPSGAGSLIVGAAATVWAVARIGIPGGATGILLFLVFLTARLALQAAAHILYCFFTVRWVYTMRLEEIMDKILAWGNYPVEVFPRFVQLLFTTIIPFSVACYWPARALLGPTGWLALASLAGTGLLVWGTLLLWKHQLEQYTSAGG